MTNPNRTHITAVIDRSGSMQSMLKETVAGINRFCQEQAALPGDVEFTLAVFDNMYEERFSSANLKSLRAITEEDVMPRGGTALYDAIARATTETGNRLSAMPENERPGKVILLIITDGMENCSTDYCGEGGRKRVKAMIEHQREKYAWEVVFLGANMDAVAVGDSLGVARHSSLTYESTGDGMTRAFKSVSAGVTRSRTGAVDATKQGYFAP